MGLIGIFFAPFLHKNFFHLLFNVIPFSVLGARARALTADACDEARSLTRPRAQACL
jgi:hypothetical protein